MTDDVVAEPRSPPTLEDLAERQDGVVSVRQARLARRDDGPDRLAAVQRAVPAVPTGRRPHRRRAAVVAAGGADRRRSRPAIAVAVSHASAVRVYGLELPPAVHRRWRRDDAFIELAAPLVRHVRLDGVRGHRCGTWAAGDVVDPRRHASHLTAFAP